MNSQLSQKTSFHMFVGLWVHSTGSYHSPLIPVHCTGSKAFLSDRTISTTCSLKILCDSWLFASMKNLKSVNSLSLSHSL